MKMSLKLKLKSTNRGVKVTKVYPKPKRTAMPAVSYEVGLPLVLTATISKELAEYLAIQLFGVYPRDRQIVIQLTTTDYAHLNGVGVIV